MATGKEFLDYVLDQLKGLNGITHRQMMGEYILYYHDKIVAYLCDDRLLVKPVKAAKELMPEAILEPPYEGAKPMLLVSNLDDRDFMEMLFEQIYEELPARKN